MSAIPSIAPDLTCGEEYEEGACGGPAEVTCDNCGLPLCELCAHPLPQDQHACCGCWEALPACFPRQPEQSGAGNCPCGRCPS